MLFIVFTYVTLLTKPVRAERTADHWLESSAEPACVRPLIPSSDENVVVEIGDLVMTDDRVTWKNREVSGLTPAMRRYLLALVDRVNEFVNFSQFKEDVWPLDRHGNLQADQVDRIIYLYAHRLRRAFRAVDPEFNALRNRYGYGYIWEEPHAPSMLVHFGDLTFTKTQDKFWWRDQPVKLTASERRVVIAFLERSPLPLRLLQIYYILHEGNPHLVLPNTPTLLNQVKVRITKIRSAFRAVDPSFSRINPTRDGKKAYRW